MTHHTQAAYQPSCRVSQSDIDNRVDELGTDKQVQLSEKYEARQHDEHRSCRVSGTAKRTCKNLVGTADNVKRTEEPDENTAIIQYIVILCKQQQHLLGEDQQQYGKYRRNGN